MTDFEIEQAAREYVKAQFKVMGKWDPSTTPISQPYRDVVAQIVRITKKAHND